MSQIPGKIGILTYTSNFNFGTFFQAYATLCSIRRLFPNSKVEIVNYNSKTKYERIGYDRLNLKKRHVYPPYLFRHLIRQISYRKFQKQFLEIDASCGLISDSYDEATEFLARQSYDLLVVGSDTVFNFYEWNFKQNEPPIYWLPPRLDTTKVMLASSIGTDLTMDNLNTSMRKTLALSAEGFALLGVRDQITYDFMMDLAPELKSQMELVPDPTFSYDVDKSHAESYLKRRRIDPKVPMIGLDLPLSLPGLREAIQHFKSKGYCVVTWRGGSKAVDYDFSDMNPFQWAGMFARFSVTLTNRFHASIFSLKNLTPVIAVDFKAKRVSACLRSKTSMLLEVFGMKDTHYRNASNLADKAWILHVMESSLAEPQIKQITAGLKSMKFAYETYLKRICKHVTQSPVLHEQGETN